jgi:hypothetical protein
VTFTSKCGSFATILGNKKMEHVVDLGGLGKAVSSCEVKSGNQGSLHGSIFPYPH